MKNRGLAFKLVALILSGTAAVFLTAFSYYYRCSEKSVMANVEKNTRNLAHSTVHEIETVLMGVEKPARNFATLLSMGRQETDDVARYTECISSSNPEIFGTAISFEPYAMDRQSYYFLDYCYREADGRLARTRLGSDSYDYFTLDWYQIPKVLDRATWSEPYFDEGGGNIMMATFSVPFYREMDGTREFQGIICVDISLLWLKNIVSALKVYQTGHAFLISRNGTFITHPYSSLIMGHTVFSVAEGSGDDSLRRIGQDMIRGGEGLVALEGNPLSRARAWMYYAPMSSTGWSLAIVIPEDESCIAISAAWAGRSS